VPRELTDPFVYDFDRLRAVASEPVIKRGIAYFKENRVTELDCDGARLWARVEGSRRDAPYIIELAHDEDGELLVECECPFDGEPVCKHAVAALLAYGAAGGTDSQALAGAAAEAIEERVQRARTEVRVKHLAGEPWFGTWRATSLASATHRKVTYTVQIRSLGERMNHCTCPDLATNQLGTCKHIEAVLHRVRKMRGYAKARDLPPAVSFVYLAWDVDEAPQIRLHRAPSRSRGLSRLLNRHFDPAGRLSGRLPEDFFRFADEVAERDDLMLGEDARQHALRVAERAARSRRAEQLGEAIGEWRGRLPGVRARLYPYQVEGVAFLAANGRALLADDMGLGKTLQAIAAATWLAREQGVARVLVVCPASLKQQWAREIGKFTEHSVQVVQGPAGARLAQYRRAATFTVVNYELVLRDLAVINETLAPDLLILDEAQRIKNWRTKIAASIKLVASRYAFVLTGTPLENRLEDLYSLMQVVDPQALGPLWRYMVDFHVTDERGKAIGYRNLSELRRRLAPVMLRRDRSLVRAQLPDRIEQRIDVPMTQKQRELHDSALSAAASLASIARRRPLTPSEQNRLMAALQQARMACNAAGLIDKKTTGSPKLDELARLLEELCVEDGLKAVVFSQWEQMTAMVEQLARRLELGCVRLHGRVPSAKRAALIERFRDDDAVKLFISTDAGGVGLNLQWASVLVNLDMPWNPAVLEQRIARVHRLGQQATVHTLLMLAADSYEERIQALVMGKRELFENVVDAKGTRDVVGLSKRTLEVLMEDLAGPPEDAPATPSAEAEPPREVEATERPRRSAGEDDGAARRLVAEAERAFGPRIERIVATNRGLLIVLDRVEPSDERMAEGLGEAPPAALVDPATFARLQRIGIAAGDGEARTLFEAETAREADPAAVRLALARERLRAAELLASERHTAGALDLIASALLSGAAARAGLAHPPSADEAPVWIYSQALPQGALSAEEGAIVVRAVSLRNAPSVPDPLVAELLADARSFIGPR